MSLIRKRSAMRYFLSILSLLMMFQPIGWAFGAQMYAHEPMDHESMIPTMLMSVAVGDHCQLDNSHHVSLDSLVDADEQQEELPAVSCIVAGSSVVSNSVATSVFLIEPQYLSVTYSPTSISFRSRSESPEIRPPHSIRS